MQSLIFSELVIKQCSSKCCSVLLVQIFAKYVEKRSKFLEKRSKYLEKRSKYLEKRSFLVKLPV